MKLTAKARYAVTAMADLAQCGDLSPIALADISVRQNISRHFLEQMFGQLRKAGLVVSQRGMRGGYSLSRKARDTRISDIVRAVDVELRVTACTPDTVGGCLGQSAKCLSHDLWDELGRHIEIFLGSITLEDVVTRNILGRAQLASSLHDKTADAPPIAHHVQTG